MNEWKILSSYNVIYSEPGQTDRSAMPIGNGELCASAWMAEDGVLQFYFGRTDCILENDRTAKLGMVKVETDPPFLSMGGFSQRLVLEEGRIEVISNLGRMEIFVAAQTNTIYVSGAFEIPVIVKAEYITWRKNEKYDIEPWVDLVRVSADVVDNTDGIIFYHKNEKNGIEDLAKLEGISNVDIIPDFLTGRVFGGRMEMMDSSKCGNVGKAESKRFELRITTLSGQYRNVDEWKRQLKEDEEKNMSYPQALKYTKAGWKEFWNKSYAFINGDIPLKPEYTDEIKSRAKETKECNTAPSQITRAYLLTKFMIACCKDGNFPILYNGFLFNLTPGNREHLKVASFAGTYTSQPMEDANEEFNPDERSWAVEQLWQNLRLPYYTMLHTGDFESLKKMFLYYMRFQKLNEERARVYYHAKGQHNTEMTLTCGLQSGKFIYGLDRRDKPLKAVDNAWGGSIQISPGLELLNLMLDYYNYTDDVLFLKHEILGFAKGIFEYIRTRFTKRRDGKILICDINCLEMFFHTDNPTPIIAGMICTLEKLIRSEIEEEDKKYFREIRSLAPGIPVSSGREPKIILPAELYEDKRMNVESPELYAVYPFGIFQKIHKNEQIAVDTFLENIEKNNMMHPHTIGMPPGSTGYSGWQYLGNAAAMLGLTDISVEILQNNAALQNPGNRFPAMWGAVHDSVPDSDHGANIMNLLQLMLLQCDQDKIWLVPTFPEQWDAKFKFFAPHNTIVTCEYEQGNLIHYEVCPKERSANVVYCHGSLNR